MNGWFVYFLMSVWFMETRAYRVAIYSTLIYWVWYSVGDIPITFLKFM